MSDDETVEKIARAIAARVHVRGEDAWRDYQAYVTAVLPIIAAEVRTAKAEAWGEAHEIGWNNADEYWRCDGLIPSYSKAYTYPNPYRTEEPTP